jgi:hypothetical protein
MMTHNNSAKERGDMAGRVVHPPPSHWCVFVFSARSGLTLPIQVSRLGALTSLMMIMMTMMRMTTMVATRTDDNNAGQGKLMDDREGDNRGRLTITQTNDKAY